MTTKYEAMREALEALLDMDIAYQRGPKVADAVDSARAVLAMPEDKPETFPEPGTSEYGSLVNKASKEADQCFSIHAERFKWLCKLEQTFRALAPQPEAQQPVQASDYEEVLADHRRLVRELDTILNGDNAAEQASLCDIVAQLRKQQQKSDECTHEFVPFVSACVKCGEPFDRGMKQLHDECTHCDGLGEIGGGVDAYTCETCKGTGKQPAQALTDFDIVTMANHAIDYSFICDVGCPTELASDEARQAGLIEFARAIEVRLK